MLEPWILNQVWIRPIRDTEFEQIVRFTPLERIPTLHCHPTLVAVIYGIVIGYASYYLDDSGLFYHGALRVVPEWQREGIATRLMQARIEIAKDFHCPAHYCIVWAHKPFMQAICEKAGMERTLSGNRRFFYVGSLVDAV